MTDTAETQPITIGAEANAPMPKKMLLQMLAEWGANSSMRADWPEIDAHRITATMARSCLYYGVAVPGWLTEITGIA